MRSFFCSILLGIAALGVVGTTAQEAKAWGWRGPGYYSAGYYGYGYGYGYPAYQSYYAGPSYYSYSPGFYGPSYGAYRSFYSGPAFRSYYGPGFGYSAYRAP